MKTTDGYELKKLHYYYLENGQCVCLEGFAETPSGIPMFVVVPFFEGEAMGCSGAGGSHREYNVPYEHEGEKILVSSIFEKAPTEKLCSRYKKQLENIEHLALSVGSLKKEISVLDNEKRRLKLENQAIVNKHSTLLTSKKETEEEVEALVCAITEKRQILSVTEDAISSAQTDGDHVSIAKGEIQALRKREFELFCLESGGVDNWEFYSESLYDFRQRYPKG